MQSVYLAIILLSCLVYPFRYGLKSLSDIVSMFHQMRGVVDEEKDGVDSVSGYSCSCPNGLRTVGCCAHVATVLWYLGFGRHQSEILIPADFLNNVCEEIGGQEQE